MVKPSCHAKKPSVLRRGTIWEIAMEEGKIVEGFVSGKVKGGLTAMVNGIRGLPCPVLWWIFKSGQGHDALRKQDHGTPRSSSLTANAIM